jgi:hypothetical protein
MTRLMLTAAAFGLALAAPALAQDAMQPASTAGTDLPVCSKDVQDRCQQGARAEAMAAETYKGGGNDNSARMTAAQAAGKRAKPKG